MPDQVELKTPLLQPLETVVIPATATPVLIRDLIKKNSKAKIATVWGEFRTRFFDKTEGPLAEMTYRKYKLMRISADGPIIAELGGDSKVEGSFAAAFALLQRQGNGESGHLQTNGYANIFYAKDKNGQLCAIRIGWTEGGWVIDAILTQDPLAWNGHHEIFCPA
jgi:hypothetical protein